MYWYADYYGYLIFVIPALIISLAAQIGVKSAFSRWSRVSCNMTGADAAMAVLKFHGVTGVAVERVAGELTDHYDPRSNVIRLSDSVYSSCSVAAVGVAAHEAGHAVQYATGYTPIKLRAAIIPVCNIGSQLSMPLVLLGIIFSNAFSIGFGTFLINFGIILFCAVLLFQLITLPVEFNASRRAVATVRDGRLLADPSQLKGVKSVLTAAALTYVAAVITALLQLLRLISLANRNNRR